MRCLALFLTAGAVFATPPTVSILGLHQPSHGSVSVEFAASGANGLRAHTSLPGGTCKSVTTGVYEYEDKTVGGSQNRKYWPYDDGSTSPIRLRLYFAGLLPNTTYELCPEATNDNGVTYSTGVGITYTTGSLPAVHPAPPIPPVDAPAVYPNTTGYTTVSPTCANVGTELTNAENRQLGTGTVINMPDPCDNLQMVFNVLSKDAISFQSSNINLQRNTIGSVTYPGGSCGAGATQVPCLTEGQAIRFGNYDAYGNIPPSHLLDVGFSQNHPIPYVFYVHYPTAGDTSNFQPFYPQPYAQCNSCLWQLGSTGSTNATGLQIIEWPRPASLKWIVIRTATADANFAPAGTRITPAWDGKMFHTFNGFFDTENSSDNNQGLLLGNVYIMGWKNAFHPDGELSPNPVTYSASGGSGHQNKTLDMEESSGPIVFDRCWLQGPTFPMRIASPIVFDGAGQAFVNGRIDQMYAWHASSTWEGINPYPGSMAGGAVSGRTITIPPGEAHGGAFNYKQTGTLTFTTTGTPTDGLSHNGIVYFDSTSAVKLTLPSGMTGTTNIGTIVPNINTPGTGSIDLTSTAIPQETTISGFSRPAVFPIAFYYIAADGTFGFLFPASVQTSSCDWNGCEGSDTIIAGRGPGPVKFANNYFNWNGNFINFDECLGGGNIVCAHDNGDYTIQRNYFFHDPKTVRSNAAWNGNLQLHRQGIEWKHGSRDWIIGNIFDGQNGCDNQNPTGTAILGKTIAGDTNDMNMEYNTVMHSCGFGGAGTYMTTGHLLADTMSRIRFANNLLSDINGWTNSSYFGPASYHGSNGWLFQLQGGIEDMEIGHNTFNVTDGIKPSLMVMQEYGEGLYVHDNQLSYNVNPGSAGAFAIDNGSNYSNDAQGHTTSTPCAGNTDSALVGCLWRNGIIKNNFIVPGTNSSNIWATTCNSGSDGDGCFGRRLLTASAQVAFSTVCTAFGGTVSGSACTGSNNYIPNYASGIPAAISSLGWTNSNLSSTFDYHALSSSPLISGSAYKSTDGKDLGADIDGLNRAQGRVILTGVSGITTTAANVNVISPDAGACSVDYSSTDSTLVSAFTRLSATCVQGPNTIALTGLTTGTAYSYRFNGAVQQPSSVFRTR